MRLSVCGVSASKARYNINTFLRRSSGYRTADAVAQNEVVSELIENRFNQSLNKLEEPFLKLFSRSAI